MGCLLLSSAAGGEIALDSGQGEETTEAAQELRRRSQQNSKGSWARGFCIFLASEIEKCRQNGQGPLQKVVVTKAPRTAISIPLACRWVAL